MNPSIVMLAKKLRESKSAIAGSHWRHSGFWKDFFELLDLIEAENRKVETAAPAREHRKVGR
jgi:hypothetical protein